MYATAAARGIAPAAYSRDAFIKIAHDLLTQLSAAHQDNKLIGNISLQAIVFYDSPEIIAYFKGYTPGTDKVIHTGYMAPELSTTRTYDRAAEVFALGIVLLQILAGQTEDDEYVQTQINTLSEDSFQWNFIRRNVDAGLTKHTLSLQRSSIIGFFNQLLAYDPTARWNAQTAKAEFEKSFPTMGSFRYHTFDAITSADSDSALAPTPRYAAASHHSCCCSWFSCCSCCHEPGPPGTPLLSGSISGLRKSP